MVNTEELTPRDVRILVRAEEELAQCRQYTRIFPSKDSDKFLKYMSPPSYADYLLDAWEATSHTRVRQGQRESYLEKEMSPKHAFAKINFRMNIEIFCLDIIIF